MLACAILLFGVISVTSHQVPSIFAAAILTTTMMVFVLSNFTFFIVVSSDFYSRA